MKIQTMKIITPSLFDTNNGQNASVAKKVTEQPGFLEESVRVSISGEGYKHYRESLLELKDYVPRKLSDEIEVQSIDFWDQEILEEPEWQVNLEFQRTCDKFSQGQPRDAASRAGKAMEAYASMYDRISKGYEDGTREIWTYEEKDGKQELRRLTKSEELAALDSAYEKLSKRLETEFKQQAKYEEIREKDCLESLRMGGLKNEKAEEIREEIKLLRWKKQHSMKPEKMYESMMNAKAEFKRTYSIGRSQAEYLKGLSDIAVTYFHVQDSGSG